MKVPTRLAGLVAASALMATTGCTISGLPWGDVKVTADKDEFPLSGPVPTGQIADPVQYQGAIRHETTTYAKARPCIRRYGVTCYENGIVYVFVDYVYKGYAYVWDGCWWTIPLGPGKSYNYYEHTYVDQSSVDASQINIEENINAANTFIDQHTEVYNQTPAPTENASPTADTPSDGPTQVTSPSPTPEQSSTPTPTPTPTVPIADPSASTSSTPSPSTTPHAESASPTQP